MEIVNGNYLQTLVVMLEQHINSQNERFEIQTNQLGLIANLLSVLSVKVTEIESNQVCLINELYQHINSFTKTCQKLDNTPQCVTPPTLMDGLYVEPNGHILTQKPQIFSWGGFNIVNSRH